MIKIAQYPVFFLSHLGEVAVSPNEAMVPGVQFSCFSESGRVQRHTSMSWLVVVVQCFAMTSNG